MRLRLLRTVAAAATATLALSTPSALAAAPATSPAAPTASHHPGPRHESCARSLDRAVAAYIDTTHRRDKAGFDALMADGYTGVLPGGTVLAGKPAIVAFIDRFFDRTDWTQTFTVNRKEVFGCRTAVVELDSTYSDADGPVPLEIGLAWTYEHGCWRVVLDQNTVVG